MSIQQSFNQGLMGTTFLLGQMPQFKQAQESNIQLSQLKNLKKTAEKGNEYLEKSVLKNKDIPENVKNDIKEQYRKGQFEQISVMSQSANPKVRVKAAIARAGLNTLFNNKAQSKREQADAKIMDKFETIEMDRERALDSIHNLRGQLSGRQTKRLIHKTNQTYDKQIDEERRSQNDPNE